MKKISILVLFAILSFHHAQAQAVPIFNGKDINNWTIHGT